MKYWSRKGESWKKAGLAEGWIPAVATGSNNCCLDRQCKQRVPRQKRGEKGKQTGFPRNHFRGRLLSVLDLPSALSFFSPADGPSSTTAAESANSILPATSIHPSQFVPPIDSEVRTPALPSRRTLREPASLVETDSAVASLHKRPDSGSNPIFHGRKLVPHIIPAFYQFLRARSAEDVVRTEIPR